jgi:hypothetical protein
MENPKNNITEKFCNDCKIMHDIDNFIGYPIKRKSANGETQIHTRHKCKIVIEIRKMIQKEKRKEYIEKNRGYIQSQKKLI